MTDEELAEIEKRYESYADPIGAATIGRLIAEVRRLRGQRIYVFGAGVMLGAWLLVFLTVGS